MNLQEQMAKMSDDNYNSVIEIKQESHLKLVESGEVEPDLVSSSAKLGVSSIREPIKRMSTGLKNIDKLFNTFVNGELQTGICAKDIILVSGMSGVGKTTFTMMMFCNMYKAKIPVTFFSFDMKDTQTWDCVKIALCGFKGTDDDYLDELQINGAKPDVICCRETIDINRIDKYLTKNKRDCIFIDYFDKLTTSFTAKTDKNRYQNVMSGLKKLVDKHNCAIFLLIQGNEDKGYKQGRPTLMNTYGGKEVRSEADHILSVYRRAKFDEDLASEYRCYTEIIGLKLRSHSTIDSALLKLDNGKMQDAQWYEESAYYEATKPKKGNK